MVKTDQNCGSPAISSYSSVGRDSSRAAFFAAAVVVRLTVVACVWAL